MKESYDFSNAKRGPVAPTKGKTRITIMLDDAVLDAARESADEQGIGYQTLINLILRRNLLAEESHEQVAGDLVPHQEVVHLQDQMETMDKLLATVEELQHRLIDAVATTRKQPGLFRPGAAFTVKVHAGKTLQAPPFKAVAQKKRAVKRHPIEN